MIQVSFFPERSILGGQRIPLLRQPLQIIQLILRKSFQGSEGATSNQQE